MARKRYTDQFRADAVLMWEATPNYLHVAKHLKIPESTLRSWVNRAGLNGNGKKPAGTAIDAKIYAENKIDFEMAIQSELYAIHEEMQTKRQDADYKELAVAYGILFDKNQLLTGGSTINENRQVLIKYAD